MQVCVKGMVLCYHSSFFSLDALLTIIIIGPLPLPLLLQYTNRRTKNGHLLLPLEEEPYFKSLPYIPPMYQEQQRHNQYTASVVRWPWIGFICNSSCDILHHHHHQQQQLSFRVMLVPEFKGVSTEFKGYIFSSNTSKWSESLWCCALPLKDLNWISLPPPLLLIMACYFGGVGMASLLGSILTTVDAVDSFRSP
ncbi:hypothetical protein ACB092_05G027700 [Castanea dentata]